MRSKLDRECKLSICPFSIKNSNPSKQKNLNVFVCYSATSGKMFGKLDHIWESKDPKTSQNGPIQ